ncbi:hypothetical protein DM01DRAFT_1333643 [Hesseltinella vesiculosa]|uniref:Uncharacterized protein n=1 Tax=Hesseltinella vesiculosa TaxID=101127 RepID=A0A1X2GN79_9FUNG|nr:hypothetical protein DM01DRAFT_1333643 [Hesseltinella vesiculosa]
MSSWFNRSSHQHVHPDSIDIKQKPISMTRRPSTHHQEPTDNDEDAIPEWMDDTPSTLTKEQQAEKMVQDSSELELWIQQMKAQDRIEPNPVDAITQDIRAMHLPSDSDQMKAISVHDLFQSSQLPPSPVDHPPHALAASDLLPSLPDPSVSSFSQPPAPPGLSQPLMPPPGFMLPNSPHYGTPMMKPDPSMYAMPPPGSFLPPPNSNASHWMPPLPQFTPPPMYPSPFVMMPYPPPHHPLPPPFPPQHPPYFSPMVSVEPTFHPPQPPRQA